MNFNNITATLFLALAVATSASGQGTLIGPSIQNGSFENGVASPWSRLSVAQNAAFASEGEWFAVLQATNPGTARTDSFQSLSADPSHGFIFILTFEARNGTTGFDSVSASLTPHNTGEVYIMPSAITPVLSPTLVSSAWSTYQIDFELPQTWDGGGSLRLDIGFTKNGSVNGTAYTAYLDNITLEQVPEPSAVSLIFLGSGILIYVRRSFVKKWSFPR